MTNAVKPKAGTKFPTVIRDPEQIVSNVKKDLQWVGIATIIAVAVSIGVYIFM